MSNSLIKVVSDNLARKFSSQEIQKRLDTKVMKQLDYELMFKILECVVDETLHVYIGSE